MKKHMSMSDETRESKIKSDFPKILNCVNKLATSLLKDVEITAENNTDGECIINCKKWGVSITPVIHQQETIGSLIDCLAWQVYAENYTPATRWEPANHDVEEVGKPLQVQPAALLFIQTIFNRMVWSAAENLTYENIDGTMTLWDE